MAQSLPAALKRSRGLRGDKEVGVTCISYNCDDKDTFLIGSEPGAIFKCGMNNQGERAGSMHLSPI